VSAQFHFEAGKAANVLAANANTGSVGVTDSVCKLLGQASTANLLACRQGGVTGGSESKVYLFFATVATATAGMRELSERIKAGGLAYIKPAKYRGVSPMSEWKNNIIAMPKETTIFSVSLAAKKAQASGTKWTNMTEKLKTGACADINTAFSSSSVAASALPIWCSHPDDCNNCDAELLFLSEDPFLTLGGANLRAAWQTILQNSQYDDGSSPAVKKQKFTLKNKMLYNASLSATLKGTTTTAAPSVGRQLFSLPSGGVKAAYGKSETDSLCKLLGQSATILSCVSGTGLTPSVKVAFASSADRLTVLQAWGKTARKDSDGLVSLVPTKLTDHGGAEKSIYKLCLEVTAGTTKWTAVSKGLETSGSACNVFKDSGAIDCVDSKCATGRQLSAAAVPDAQGIELAFAEGAATSPTQKMYEGIQKALVYSASGPSSSLKKVGGKATPALQYDISIPVLASSTTGAPMVASTSGVMDLDKSACKILAGASRITRALTCVNDAIASAAGGKMTLAFASLKDACSGAREMQSVAVPASHSKKVVMALKTYAGVAVDRRNITFTAKIAIVKNLTGKYNAAGICADLAGLTADGVKDIATFAECHITADIKKDAEGSISLVYLTTAEGNKAEVAWNAAKATDATIKKYVKSGGTFAAGKAAKPAPTPASSSPADSPSAAGAPAPSPKKATTGTFRSVAALFIGVSLAML
jgi:hypothetical protein